MKKIVAIISIVCMSSYVLGQVSISGKFIILKSDCAEVEKSNVEESTPAKESFSILEQNELKSLLSIVPNPASDAIFLKSGSSMPYSFELINMAGSVILAGQLYEEKTWLDVSNLLPGLYLIRINTNGKIHQSKLMIKR